MSKIKVNQRLPNFAGKTFDGQTVDLSVLVGESNVVLYFYPKDDTPGCTVEGIEFSELNKEFRKQNTWVVGVSRDGMDSHQRFCRRHNIRIPLLSDEDGNYGRRLGLLKDTGGPARFALRSKAGGYRRATVLIGRDGKIKHIWEDVKANGHAREVLGKVKELEHQSRKKLALGRDLGPARRNYAKPGIRAAARSQVSPPKH